MLKCRVEELSPPKRYIYIYWLRVCVCSYVSVCLSCFNSRKRKSEETTGDIAEKKIKLEASKSAAFYDIIMM